ncbi:MAG: LPXTG cell wall anchor domain-containing protein [Acidimicrobiia bacterium]|nr:LPXTG cell wall anchor domain-containing protein [Acidimicrobiia bacterium]
MDDDMDDDMADDMADDMDDDMADDMADDEMLADTGSNTPLLAIVALAVVLAGAMVLGLSRRLRIQ